MPGQAEIEAVQRYPALKRQHEMWRATIERSAGRVATLAGAGVPVPAELRSRLARLMGWWRESDQAFEAYRALIVRAAEQAVADRRLTRQQIDDAGLRGFVVPLVVAAVIATGYTAYQIRLLLEHYVNLEHKKDMELEARALDVETRVYAQRMTDPNTPWVPFRPTDPTNLNSALARVGVAVGLAAVAGLALRAMFADWLRSKA